MRALKHRLARESRRVRTETRNYWRQERDAKYAADQSTVSDVSGETLGVTIESGLMIAGIEPNPGMPRGRGNAQAKDKSERKSALRGHDKPAKNRGPKEGDAVVEALKAEITELVAREQAGDDVAKQRAAEEAERAAEELRAKKREQVRGEVVSQETIPPEVWFNPFKPGDMTWWVGVGHREQDLMDYPLPHVRAHAVLDGTNWHDEKDAVLSSHDSILKIPKGVVTELRYRVTFHHYYSLARVNDRVEELAMDVVTIPLEQWLLARSRRVGAHCSFPEAVTRVADFRSAHPNFCTGSYKHNLDGNMSDQVFTALLYLENTKLEQDFYARLAASWLSAKPRELLMERYAADHETAMVRGTYVRGYEVPFSELFKPEVAAAVAAVKSGAQSVNDAAWAVRNRLAEEVDVKVARAKKHIRAVRAEGWEYCRKLPFSVRNLCPRFPNPMSVTSNITAIVKRIISKKRTPDAVARAYEEEVAEAVIGQLLEARPNGIPPEMVEAEAEEHLKHVSGWSDDDRAAFRRGVYEVLHSNAQDLLAAMDRVGVFIKQEAYDEAGKAARYIVAPSHYVRGLLFGVTIGPEITFMEVFREHLNKGLTDEQIRAKIHETFLGFIGVLEQDFSSFESLVDQIRQRIMELPAYRLLNPPYLQNNCEALFDRLSRVCPVFNGAGLEGHMPVIRRSGTSQTSIGNAMANTVMSFGSLFRTMRVPLGKVKDTFHGWHLPWMVEGDDGLFVLPNHHYDDQRPVTADEWHATAVSSGQRVTGDEVEVAEDANYCGVTMVGDAGTRGSKYRNVIGVLARAGAYLGAETTDVADRMLAAAKALSYRLQFPQMPVVRPWCDRVIRECRQEVVRIRSEGGVSGPAAKWIADWLERHHMTKADLRKEPEPYVPSEAMVRLAAADFETTADGIKKLEEQIANSPVDETGQIPTFLDSFFLARAEADGLLIRWFEGRREAAAAGLESLASSVRAAGVLGGWLAKAVSVNVLGWLANLCTMTSLCVVIYLFGWMAALGWCAVTAAGTAVLFMVLIVYYGLSWRMAWRFINAVTWLVTFIYLAPWIRVAWRCAAKALVSRARGGGAPSSSGGPPVPPVHAPASPPPPADDKKSSPAPAKSSPPQREKFFKWGSHC